MVKEGNGGKFSETLSACLLRVTQCLPALPCGAQKDEGNDADRVHDEENDEPSFPIHARRSPHADCFECEVEQEEDDDEGNDSAKVIDGADELHVFDEVLVVHHGERGNLPQSTLRYA